MARGRVKWWNDAKGYGFITDADGEDVFIHYSSLQMEGFKTLSEGQQVEFEITRGPKGPQAANVSLNRGTRVRCRADGFSTL